MSQTKTILLITSARRKASSGGPSLVVHMLMKSLHSVKSDFSYEAVFSDTVAKNLNQLEPSAKDYFRSGRFPRLPMWVAGNLITSFAVVFNLARARLGLRKAETVVNAHDFIAGFISHLMLRPHLILTLHYKGGWADETLVEFPYLRGSVLHRVIRCIERKSINACEAVVFPSKGAREAFEKSHSGWLSQKRVTVIYNGVDFKEIDSMRNVRTYSKDCPANLVLFVGGLVKEKGVDVLVNAMSKLPKQVPLGSTCFIIGKGYILNDLRKLISRLGLEDRVQLLGFVSRAEVLGWMKSAKVFAVPSRVSVFDYALLEAAASGAAIITTQTGGNLEMFSRDSVIFVETDNVEQLADGIQLLLTDQELRSALTQKSTRWVRDNFSIEKMALSYQREYAHLARKYF